MEGKSNVLPIPHALQQHFLPTSWFSVKKRENARGDAAQGNRKHSQQVLTVCARKSVRAYAHVHACKCVCKREKDNKYWKAP